MAACQPFQQGTQHEQHLPQHGSSSCVLPVYGGMALGQTSSVSPPAVPELSLSSGRSETEAKALKIHSEAERRRRERINAHLATLKGMIPDRRQMDKATLLASAISQLKNLKRKASEATQPMPIPAESNGVTVDCCYTGAAIGDERTMYIQASVSCEDRPGLLADIATAFHGLRLRAVRADMASLGGRTQCNFVLCKEGSAVNLMKPLEEAVKQALASAAFSDMAHGCSSSRTRSKRQRILESRILYSAMD